MSTWVAKLGLWFNRNHRKLPWRETRDPYRIWLSEVMLQQTQVTTVLPYYARFLERFPSLEALAKAKEEDVLAAWSGLGYYSRARNLKRGAEFLIAKYEGKFPRTREAILEVPGIGPYTAGAILSIAFDLRVALVDGNVERVFSRLFAFPTEIESPKAKAFFWKQAEKAVLSCESPRVFNQALMELGALICTKGTPRCGVCPVEASCVAFLKGIQTKLPKRKPKREKVDLVWAGYVIEAQGKIFVHRNKRGAWWEGMWDIPREETTAALLEGRAAEFRERLPGVRQWKKLGTERHTVTHHRLTLAPYHIQLARPSAPKGWVGEWLRPEEIDEAPISSLMKKVMANLKSAGDV